jgi:hypothetical protein
LVHSTLTTLFFVSGESSYKKQRTELKGRGMDRMGRKGKEKGLYEILSSVKRFWKNENLDISPD